MGRNRRVTLRCASEDLPSDWTTQTDLANVRRLREITQSAVIGDAPDSAVSRQLKMLPALAALRHPLIRAFDEQFAGQDDASLFREAISAVSDRQWLKQTYSSRWRGAAIVLPGDDVETVWLGAAGYHRAGSPEDFYQTFARRCQGGSEPFLPAAEDFKLLAVEDKVARFDAWKLQLHLSALVLLANALDDPESTYNVTVYSPNGDELLTMSMVVIPTTVDDVTVHELIIELHPRDWESPLLCEHASRVVTTAIDPQLETWTAAPLTENVESHWTVLTARAMDAARAAAAVGTVDADARPGEVRLGTIAHYTHSDQITYASVHGEAVRAMCGYWFVPTADHKDKPTCPTCQDAYERTPV